MEFRTRRRWALGAIGAAIVCVTVWQLTPGAPGTLWRVGPDDPALRASTPVATVARDYLAAAERHECGVTRALTTSNTWSWCLDPALLSYDHVRRPYVVSAAMAGRTETCVDFTMHASSSSDGSMPTGEQPWGLCFVHTRSGWRLWDQGQG